MINLSVNGRRRAFSGPPWKRLLDVLREDFALTGTKEGCGEGECGACTVLIDGAPVNSCLIPACQVAGQRVETIESLGRPAALSVLQERFLAMGGAQCGICTPGMLMAAWAHVKAGGSASPDAVREQLAGNLCRCTGYQAIVDAVIETIRLETIRKSRKRIVSIPGQRSVAAPRKKSVRPPRKKSVRSPKKRAAPLSRKRTVASATKKSAAPDKRKSRPRRKSVVRSAMSPKTRSVKTR